MLFYIGGDASNRYTRDLEHIFLALTKRYGYKKENIFVHFIGCEQFFNVDLDGDDESDFDFLTSEEEIERTFLNLAGLENTVPSIPKLKHKDQLFIYSTGHGGVDESTWNSYLKKIYFEDYTFYMSEIYDYTFAQYLENINCSNITMVMNECYSGGFINDIIDVSNALCKNRIINTACKIDEKSWEEYWITIRKYDEFVFYWTDAVRGIYPDPVEYHAWFELTTTGTFPFNNYFPSSVIHPDDYDPDLDNDGFIQLGEAFHYANDFDSRSQYGFFCPPNPNNAHWENPQDSINISFREDLLTLAGFAGEVENTQTIANRSYLLGGELKIKTGVTLTVSDSAAFYLGNENAVIRVDSGATLILGDHVSIYGDSINKILVYGEIQFGDYDSLKRLSDTTYFDGLYLMNSIAQTSINKAYFEYARLHHYGDSLVIDSTEFKDCYSIDSYEGDVTVTYSNFDDTRLYLEIDGTSTDKEAIIRYNDFETLWDTINAVDLNKYDNYYIEHNEVEGYENGIQVYNAGGGSAGKQKIVENDISSCDNNGIMVYGSTARIEKNIVGSCECGVSLNNESSTDLKGDNTADTTIETQYIHDNNSYEIYVAQYSFPRRFVYNAIIDEDNGGSPNDPLLYFNTKSETPNTIEYNCWGENFNYQDDFYPNVTGVFDYEPTWCPSGSKKKSTVKSIFNEALALFEAGNYTQAKDKFIQIIDEYPATLSAQEALKELYRIEKFTSNNYSMLKQFYNNSAIQEDSILQYVGDFFANKCDVKLENWQLAIDWYENHIQYPNSFEDSIFAIIDLGYLYMLMENGGEKSISGSMQEHIPYSEFQFFAKRDYLLSLLPGDLQSNKPLLDNLYGLQAGELLQNRPNPFSLESTIYFKLVKPAAVTVKVFNNMGIIKYQFTNSYMPEGTHGIIINANDFASGVYNYTLEINGKKADVKRMVVVK
ncbi:MAG: T9SS type A sorting domain-containing protein [Bacteroidales bacterium]|nr:T9SS type A sorting domain-containing protein [Bacteroidales bacterium]